MLTDEQRERLHAKIDRSGGEDACWSRLTDQDRSAIRMMLAGGASQSALGRLYGVSQTTIWRLAQEA